MLQVRRAAALEANVSTSVVQQLKRSVWGKLLSRCLSVCSSSAPSTLSSHSHLLFMRVFAVIYPRVRVNLHELHCCMCSSLCRIVQRQLFCIATRITQLDACILLPQFPHPNHPPPAYLSIVGLWDFGILGTKSISFAMYIFNGSLG